MNYINCTIKLTDQLITDTIRFWSQNSFQHIDVLLNGYEGTGAVLYPSFQSTLKSLSTGFNDAFTQTDTIKNSKELKVLLKYFLDLNTQFIELLQRLKFEGFNGYPVLYETVYHFIYEQEYIAELFKQLGLTPNQKVTSVLINAFFKKANNYRTVLECIYSHIYFWSLIGAEHTSIIETVSPAEDALPAETKQILMDYNNRFNSINFQLSNAYSTLNEVTLCKIFKEFEETSNSFLMLLNDFKSPNSKLFPASIKSQLPSLFGDVSEHLINEHTYIASLCEDFEKVLCHNI